MSEPTLLIQKKVEFSAARMGEGHNYEVYFAFSGPIDSDTRMILELSLAKRIIQNDVLDTFDHHVLDGSLEDIALALLEKAEVAFNAQLAKPVRCTLVESEEKVIQVDKLNRETPRILHAHELVDFYKMATVTFNALHQICNDAVSGKCTRLHGHQFKLMMSLNRPVDEVLTHRLKAACLPFNNALITTTAEDFLLTLYENLKDLDWIELALQETPNNMFILCRSS